MATVYLRYMGSDWGAPTTNLGDSHLHTLYFSGDAERSLYRDPYLTNSNDNDVHGFIDAVYSFTIPLAGRLAVRQTHTDGRNSRESTAYYEATVEEITTDLLYRSDRGQILITCVCTGLVLVSGYTLLRRSRI